MPANGLTTFIPAGGYGTRLAPHTFDFPKPMLLMGSADRRLIDTSLEIGASTDHAWVSTDYLGGQIASYVEGMAGITVLRDSKTVGSGGSLIEHYDAVSDIDRDGSMLLLPADQVLTGFDVQAYYEKHLELEADITALTVPAKEYGEYVAISGDFVKSVEKYAQYDNLSTTGIFMVKNKYLLDWLKLRRILPDYGVQCNIYYDLICPAIGEALVGHHFLNNEVSRWDDGGTVNRYWANNMLLSGDKNVISAEASIGPEVSLTRCVVLGGTVLEGSVSIANSIVSRHGATRISAINRVREGSF